MRTAQKVIPPGTTPEQARTKLRDQLRNELLKTKNNEASEMTEAKDPASQSPQRAAAQDQEDATADLTPDPPHKSIDDQAHENYMQSKNSKSGGTNAGDLGSPPPELERLDPAPIGGLSAN
jgi:hypothetical protein